MTIPVRMDIHGLKNEIASNGNLLVLDVRTPAEFKSAHVPGAVNVPLDVLESNPGRFAAAIDRDTAIICRKGPRAERAQRALGEAGFNRTGVVEGGTEGWRDAGYELEYGAQRWDLERQVRLVAGSIVAAGVVASTVVPKAKWVSAGIGSGLVFAAVSNTCAMGNLLMKLPYNSGAKSPSVTQAVSRVRHG